MQHGPIRPRCFMSSQSRPHKTCGGGCVALCQECLPLSSAWFRPHRIPSVPPSVFSTPIRPSSASHFLRSGFEGESRWPSRRRRRASFASQVRGVLIRPLSSKTALKVSDHEAHLNPCGGRAAASAQTGIRSHSPAGLFIKRTELGVLVAHPFHPNLDPARNQPGPAVNVHHVGQARNRRARIQDEEFLR
jgi:hypothetical protein